MNHSLFEQLENYNQMDYYPFHMPGHKRNSEIKGFPVGIDITEIEGFDNLHHASSVLLEAQQKAAALYGAEESFFLVNGSTAGILSAISAAVSSNGSILLARNSHKAAYHGIFLRNIRAEYVYPEMIESYGICGGINPNEVKRALEHNRSIEAVFITSPTYEGMLSNIEEIADITHRNHAVLIVDEAHGAHLNPSGGEFPAGALDGQADIVIQSLHKTLPSLTQTAVLHVQGERVNRGKLRKYLQIYQTSSPSYLFMASIDSCIHMLNTQGRELFRVYKERLNRFYEQVKDLKFLHLLSPEEVEGIAAIQAMDASKLCIFSSQAGISGSRLYNYLLERYHLQMEMAAGEYVLAMTSIMDREEGFARLNQALHELDQEVCQSAENASEWAQLPKAEIIMTAAEAEEQEREILPFIESEGRVSLEYRYVYPPGIPVLVPGERITREVLEVLSYYHSRNLNIQGQESGKGKIAVINRMK